MERFVAFVDAGFIKAEGAKSLGYNKPRLDALVLIQYLRGLDLMEMSSQQFLRAYWYDGAYRTSDPRFEGQRSYYEAIALTPGLALRLGTIKSQPPPWLPALREALRNRGVELESLEIRTGPIDVQKGIDTLIVLDMVKLAEKRAYQTAVLVAGDGDLLEAVRTVQDEGRAVVLLHPAGAGVDRELLRTVDDAVVIPRDVLERMFQERPDGKGLTQ